MSTEGKKSIEAYEERVHMHHAFHQPFMSNLFSYDESVDDKYRHQPTSRTKGLRSHVQTLYYREEVKKYYCIINLQRSRLKYIVSNTCDRFHRDNDELIRNGLLRTRTFEKKNIKKVL